MKWSKLHYLLLPIVFVLHSPQKFHKTYFENCTVRRVLDGDTVDIQCSNGPRERVRLAWIDAPELTQKAFDHTEIGKLSKEALTHALIGRQVNLVSFGRGYYGRLLGEIFLDGRSFNLWMVTGGWALPGHFSRHDSYKRELFARGLHQAMVKRQGIWRTPGFLSPAKYRKMSP